MKVVVPFTRLRSETYQALGGNAEFVDVSGDPYAYYWLVRRLWVAGQPFVIVEHDIIVRPDTITQFIACKREWCVFPYRIKGGAVMNSFGCVRFRDTILSRERDLFSVIGDPVPWWKLDASVERELLFRNGHIKHTHEPLLEHLHVR